MKVSMEIFSFWKSADERYWKNCKGKMQKD